MEHMYTLIMYRKNSEDVKSSCRIYTTALLDKVIELAADFEFLRLPESGVSGKRIYHKPVLLVDGECVWDFDDIVKLIGDNCRDRINDVDVNDIVRKIDARVLELRENARKRQTENEMRQDEIEDEERATYERLKQKYGNDGKS